MPEDRPSPRLDGLLREAAARIGTVDAQWLLAHALGKPRSWLYAHADACVDDATTACFASLVERRHQGEPVAYLTGRRGFWKFELQVTADTLIPRPETELLVECALELLPRDAVSRIADLGTGTGAVALALAFERPRAQVLATDASERALDVARSNARALRLGNIGFAAGDWLAALGHARFDLVVSNPPYIAADDPHLGEGDLRFEPSSALASGRDGLDAIRRIVRDAGRHIEAGGWLLLEHGFDQGDAVRALLADAGFGQVRTERDLEQRERVSIGRNPADSPVI